MNKIQVHCPLTYTLSRFDGKWKPLILWAVKDGPQRFGELRRGIPDASLKMLTKHLKELENDGMLLRTIFPQIPPRVEYQLTALGKSFLTILDAMRAWGAQHHVCKPTAKKKPKTRGRWRCA